MVFSEVAASSGVLPVGEMWDMIPPDLPQPPPKSSAPVLQITQMWDAIPPDLPQPPPKPSATVLQTTQLWDVIAPDLPQPPARLNFVSPAGAVPMQVGDLTLTENIVMPDPPPWPKLIAVSLATPMSIGQPPGLPTQLRLDWVTPDWPAPPGK